MALSNHREVGAVRLPAVVVGLLGACAFAYGQAPGIPKPKELSEASVLNEAQLMIQSNLLKLSKPYEVSGTTRFDGWFIVADKVVFKSGAQLVFTRQAQQVRRNFFIVTKELVAEDSNAPGVITYEKLASDTAGAKPGQGPSGPHGTYDGTSGQQEGEARPVRRARLDIPRLQLL